MNKSYKFFIGFTLILTFLLFSAPNLFSQAGRGKARLGGTVKDQQGNPVVQAKVTLQFLENENVVRETTTNKKGNWAVPGLQNGPWRVTVRAEGYAPVAKTVQVSEINRNPPVDIVLKKKKEEAMVGEAPGLEFFEKGNQQFKQKNYQQALENYNKFLEENPDLFQVHLSIGNCYREMGQMEKALEEYQIVIDKADEEKQKEKEVKAKAIAGIGEVHLMQDDLDQAQQYFEKSLELNPKDSILAYNVGEIYFSHQKMDQAIKYYEMAAQINPDWSDPYLRMGYTYLNKKEYEKAEEKFNKFLEMEPNTKRAASVKNVLEYIQELK
ncbi:tetratricopeptide repeat protein [bacterium]|nr:tetratricopeptide repeat protein [bacterium]